MKKRTLIILASVALVIIIAAIVGLSMYFKPVKNFSASKADITMSSKSFFEEFLKDQSTANSKYVVNDKTIQITGKIADIKKNDDGTVSVLLDVENPEGDVSCALTKEESLKADKYKPGMTIIIKGQCTGFQELINKEVIMIRCGIVE